MLRTTFYSFVFTKNVCMSFPGSIMNWRVKTLPLLSLLLFFFCMHAYANQAHINNFSGVTLNEVNTPLKLVFKKIKQQTGFNIICAYEILEQTGNVNIKVANAPLESAMDMLLADKGLTYTIREKTIIVRKAANTKSVLVVANTPPVEIRGKVTAEDGSPMEGVTVRVKGGTIGVSTNARGEFTIHLPDNASGILVFSHIDAEAMEVAIAGRKEVNVTLKRGVIQKAEIVVVGYGTQKKVNLTGAVAVVSAKEIENRPAASVSTALAGQVPGLTVVQKSGKPGDNFGTLRVRGIGTLGNSDPLVLVDGMEASIAEVDVNDIDNVSILMDAASSAIYGIRAANGVILITTKKGKSGKPILKYSGGLGWMEPIKLPARVDALTYAEMYNQARLNDGAAPRYSQDDLDKWRTGSAPITHQNNDQYSMLLRTGDKLRHFHNLSLSGGTDATQYYMSLGYNYDGGLISTFGYDRINYRLNLTQKITNKLKAGINAAGVFVRKKENSQAAGQILSEAYRAHPGAAVYYDGPGLWANGTSWTSARNMIAYVKAPIGTNNSASNDYILTPFLEYEPVTGLKLTAQFNAKNDNFRRNYNRNNMFWYQYNPANGNYDKIELTTGNLDKEVDTRWDITRRVQATYVRSIGSHNINLLAGYEQRNINYEYFEGGRDNLRGVDQITQISGVSDAADYAKGSLTQYRSQSVFGRVTYNYKERYLFEGNLRYDGTSRFPADSRFSYFPSFSAGWRISNEPFFKSDLINNLKLRASWGKLGNEAIGDYAYLNVYQAGTNYLFGNTMNSSVVERTPLANTGIGWEKLTSSNIGLDLTMLNNRLNITAEYFIKNTNDILLALPQPAILGAAAPTVNAGAVRNKGFTVVADYHGTMGKAFEFNLNTNFSYVKNTITDLKGADAPGRSVGDPINNIYGYVADGIFQSQDEINKAPDQTSFGGSPLPGDVRYADINGRDANGKLTGKPDGKVNADDRKSLGTFFPKYTFGLQAGFNYKGIDFSMLWQGVAGVQALTQGPLVQPFAGEARPLKSMVDNTWSPDNPGAQLPRLSLTRATRNYVPSTFWMKNSSFAKLRNLQVGYTLPTAITKNLLKFNKIRVYVSGENLLQFSRFRFDPEFANGDPTMWDDNNYPSGRLYYAGLNLTF
jgi:TonB-linked SusC/RagA family outer membrane protein